MRCECHNAVWMSGGGGGGVGSVNATYRIDPCMSVLMDLDPRP